jgi:TRAP-type mannitol/chloroaromatic compound transport system permease small subunit
MMYSGGGTQLDVATFQQNYDTGNVQQITLRVHTREYTREKYMGYIVGGFFLLLVLIPVFMIFMFVQFGTTPNDVIELYKKLRGLQFSKFKAIIIVSFILILLFSLWEAFGVLTGTVHIEF